MITFKRDKKEEEDGNYELIFLSFLAKALLASKKKIGSRGRLGISGSL